jgi:hypothetical protein
MAFPLAIHLAVMMMMTLILILPLPNPLVVETLRDSVFPHTDHTVMTKMKGVGRADQVNVVIKVTPAHEVQVTTMKTKRPTMVNVAHHEEDVDMAVVGEMVVAAMVVVVIIVVERGAVVEVVGRRRIVLVRPIPS